MTDICNTDLQKPVTLQAVQKTSANDVSRVGVFFLSVVITKHQGVFAIAFREFFHVRKNREKHPKTELTHEKSPNTTVKLTVPVQAASAFFRTAPKSGDRQ